MDRARGSERTVSVEQAQAEMDALIDEVLAGGEIIIESPGHGPIRMIAVDDNAKQLSPRAG